MSNISFALFSDPLSLLFTFCILLLTLHFMSVMTEANRLFLIATFPVIYVIKRLI